ncbi:MAG: DsbA family protein [Candidatus Aenigmarchaeota archaeon]|nr:DsbA family protein [Candidatus Aenigmarchaeota archaeon]
MSKESTVLVIGVVIVIVILAALAINLAQPKTDVIKKDPVITKEPVKTPENPKISVDDDPYIGSNSSKITIVEFSDFQCDFCGKFHRDTFPLIKKNYIDTGKVKFVYRDYPIQGHDFAIQSAEAADCALEQNKFWEYHDILFNNQNALDLASLKKYAKDLGLNETRFNDCLDSEEYRPELVNDANDGIKYGVTQTPYFFINGVAIDGAYPYNIFESVIEQELAKVSSN